MNEKQPTADETLCLVSYIVDDAAWFVEECCGHNAAAAELRQANALREIAAALPVEVLKEAVCSRA